MHEGDRSTTVAVLLFINKVLLIIFLIKFFCKNKTESSTKKGFPVKLGKGVLLKGVPWEEIM